MPAFNLRYSYCKRPMPEPRTCSCPTLLLTASSCSILPAAFYNIRTSSRNEFLQPGNQRLTA